jgi:hypothetical protein
MALPSSGQISFSQIAQITKNSTTAAVSLGESDSRTLLGISSGQISISSGYGKPASGGTNYTTPGTYTFVVPAYQTLNADIAGAGSGGGGGYGCGCLQFYYAICQWCAGCSGNEGGGTGGTSSFNGAAGNGGAWGVQGATVSAGDVSSATTGGGGAGGAAGGGHDYCPSSGSGGYAGGRIITSWTKGSNGPAYGASITVTVGAGAAGGYSNGGTGGNGWVYLSWS